ncbi:MAG: SDR family NAD(P)-dependent oxidoreductase [Myxococcota bacterium]
MSHGRFKNPLQAALAGVNDLFSKQPLADQLTDDLRLEGRTALVTGASSGLGFAVATQLAERGARVLMVARSGVPERAEAVKVAAGHDRVEMFRADLSDLGQVHGLADWLKDRAPIDLVVENAGMASPRATPTPQGLEAMFVTNYLAKFVLIDRLLKDGTIPNRVYASHAAKGPKPRIIVVSSDSHQGASAIDWEEFGSLKPFGVNGAINNYSYFKLILNTWSVELSRRLDPGGETDVSVHVMCPGPVNTNIIREAPWALRGVLKVIFTLFFRSPEVAARPVVLMAAHDEFAASTGRYLHMFKPKKMDAKCYDRDEGQKLWTRSMDLVQAASASSAL